MGAEPRTNFDDHRRDNRVQMKMPVDVDVIERQASREKGAKLRLDFRSHLRPRRCVQRELESEPGEIRAQTPASVHQMPDFRGRQNRRGIGQCEMKADPQARQPPGSPDRVFGMSPRDHQARRRQDASRASDFDGFIHFASEAEIVGGDDQTIQVGSPRRWRRNDMNSIPSRSRRTSISRLRAISETIEAIFEVRK